MLKVKLSSFEGPLDLLLHLIEKAEVDVYQISVAEIADQYVEYIRQAEREQFEIASEYLVMAATLLAIKSKMLLPRTEEELDDSHEWEGQEEDLQHALLERLMEYKKYKQVVPFFRREEAKRSLIFTRPASDLSAYVDHQSTPTLAPVSLFDLVGALFNILSKKKDPPVNTIKGEAVSLGQRMDEIRQELSEKKKMTFTQLFSMNRQRPYIVTTFLALLELIKKREVYCLQKRLFGEIIIYVMETGAYGSSGA
jgi:segregation and condensation protein A